MAEKYICTKKMKVKDGDGYRTMLPGEPCPQANDWPNLKSWIRQKYVALIGNDDAPPPPKTQPKPKAVAKSEPIELEEELETYTESQLRRMNKASLIELCKEMELEIDDDATKADLVDGIMEHQE